MRFSELTKAAIQLLKDSERLTYRALQREFDIDSGTLDDLKAELIKARKVARDEDGEVLVWVGGVAGSSVQPTAKPIAYTPPHLVERIRSQQQAMAARGAEGERKTITVLFADLKGSTAFVEGLDPEVARAVIDPALQIMMDAVHRYEGYVAQALGDGILALFGAPLAHEDHAQRAVFAALRMQEELKRYADSVRLKHGAPLAMRVGLNTGEVVVRSIRKDDLHTDYVPVGHSINLAARMEQMASPGSILITEYTAKLVERYFALKGLGAAEIKGVELPLPVFEVTGLGASRTRLQVAANRGLSHFVGRQHELEQMRRALEQAREGRGQVIGIMGEPGMGKSRLVHEFKATAQGFAIFEAYSASHGKASPYLPITELLKGYFQIQLQDDEQTPREKVIGKLLGLDRSLEEVLPYYFALLNIEDADSPLPQVDASLRRRRTFDALKKVALRASLEQPLLIIFEDLHWIDSETQGYLDGLVESIGSARILLLTNYRPEYRHEWGTKTYCTQLRLAPFGRVEAEEFLNTLLGEPADSAIATRLGTLRQWILEKTEGTPFFMEEVVQELFEQGMLQRDVNGKVLLTTHPAIQVQIPTTVQGVLAARIDRLLPDERALLQQLAVIGREFPFSLARAVVAKPEDDLYRLLNALQRKEFLYEQTAFPEVTYLFKHALTQEVAYNTLLLETRRAIHESTAQAIESACCLELEDHVGSLAHHYTRSGNVLKGLEFSQAAGIQAAQRAASAEAVNYFKTSLALLRTFPPAPERDRKEFELLIALGPQLVIVNGIAGTETGEIYLLARELCEKVGTPAALCAVLIGLRVHTAVRGECTKALAYAQELLGLAQKIQVSELVCHGHIALSVSYFSLGRISEANEQAIAALALYSPERDRNQTVLYGFDARVGGLNIHSWSLWVLGYPDQSSSQVEQSIAYASTLGYPFMDGFALMWAAMGHCLRRDHQACYKCADTLLPLAQEHAFPEWAAWALILRGWARSHLGELGASKEVAQGLHGQGQIFARLVYPHWAGCLAETHINESHFDAAMTAVADAREVAAHTQEHWFDAELCRLHGEILMRKNASAPSTAQRLAEAAFEQGIEIARVQNAKSFELRCTMSLARLWITQGRLAEARERLTAVYDWFTEGFDTRDLIEARALLNRGYTRHPEV